MNPALRPSSLPMIQQCACFESSGTGGADADAGTSRHSALAWLLDGDAKESDKAEALAVLDEPDREAVEWAAEYIRTHAPMSDYPLKVEETLTLVDAEFERVFQGTPDVVCGNHLFDLKWRQRDYTAQMAAYALMLMEESGWNEITVHVLFGERKRAERFKLDHDWTENYVFSIVESTRKPDREPVPNEYCGWCAKRLGCPAMTNTASTVARGYSVLDKVHNWHPSEQTDAEQIATMLYIWRVVLKKWGESVEHFALEAAIKQGLSLPGFELKTKAGKSYVADVAGAFAAAGLPQEEFLRACEVRMNTSKAYPDKVGLVDLFASAKGLKKAPAKRDLIAKLGPALQEGKPSQYLKATGDSEDSE